MQKIILLSLLILISSYSSAQDTKLQLAFVATPQASWLSSDNASAEYAGTRLGYSLGLQGDYFFTKNYAISTSVLYSKLGGKIQYNTATPMNVRIGGSTAILNPGDELLYNLAYIEIPIGLKLKTKEFRRNSYWGQIGLSPMVNVSSANKDKNSLSEEVGLFNFGYHFGAGTDFSLGGSTYLTAALMLTNGLVDITTNDQFKDKASLSAVNLRIGIIF